MEISNKVRVITLVISFISFTIASYSEGIYQPCSEFDTIPIGETRVIPDDDCEKAKCRSFEISHGKYKLCLNIRYLEKGVVDSTGLKIQNPVLSQELVFYAENIETRRHSWPVSTFSVISSGIDTFRVLENIVFEIGIIEGENNQILFSVQGAGYCNACPEMFTLYNVDGECLWLNYSNKFNVYRSEGDFIVALDGIGAKATEWQRGNYRKIETRIK